MSTEFSDEEQESYVEVRLSIKSYIDALNANFKFSSPSNAQLTISNASKIIQNSPKNLNKVKASTLIDILYLYEDLKSIALPSIAENEQVKQAKVNLDKSYKLIKDLVKKVSASQASTSSFEARENVEPGRAIDLSRNEILKIEKKLESLTVKLSNYENFYNEHVDGFKEKQENAVNEIETLLQNFRILTTETGQDVIIRDYRDGAAQEKKQSEFFRNVATAFMLLSVSIVFYFLFWTTSAELFSTATAIKLLASLFLSIPAAYFARESTRHRRQQYLYQQYSFNLNALGPFMADLEKSLKDDLKSVVAKKIFTTAHEPGSNDDSYPINIQEILMLLLSKAEVNPAAKQTDKPKSAD